MTPGLVKCCEIKSYLYKRYKQNNTEKSKNKYITYRNELDSILRKAEKMYFDNKINACKGNIGKA